MKKAYEKPRLSVMDNLQDVVLASGDLFDLGSNDWGVEDEL